MHFAYNGGRVTDYLYLSVAEGCLTALKEAHHPLSTVSRCLRPVISVCTRTPERKKPATSPQLHVVAFPLAETLSRLSSEVLAVVPCNSNSCDRVQYHVYRPPRPAPVMHALVRQSRGCLVPCMMHWQQSASRPIRG